VFVIGLIKLRVEDGRETEARREVREKMKMQMQMVRNRMQRTDVELARQWCGRDGSSMRVAKSVLSVMLLLEKRQKIHVGGVKSRAMAHNSDCAIEQTGSDVDPC
jgi:single-stranded DNA-binding protein